MKIVSSVKDARRHLELKLADDRLKLFLSVIPHEGVVDFSEQELFDVVRTVASEELIDRGVLKSIATKLNCGEACKERRVAKGRDIVPGLDGRVVWLVKKLGQESEVQTDERGFADFVHMHLFDNIAPGQKILRVYKPKPGSPGLDVAGKSLAAPVGKPSSLRFEPSINLSLQPNEAFDIAIAEVAGYAFQQSDTVGIKDTLAIVGDLDYRYGSIDFIGAVSVSGDVHKGFSIKSEKGIAINGGVQGGNTLIATEGIRVGGTHFGGSDKALSRSGWYEARAARAVKVDTDGPIVIQREAFDCDLTSRDVVYAPKASVVGGTTRCVKGMEVGHLGNETGKTTTVILATGPEATVEFMHLEQDIARHEEAAQLLTLHLGPYASLGIRIDKLNEPQRTKIKKLYDKLQAVQASLAALKLRKKDLLSVLSEATPFVTVHQALHAGVVIKRGEVVFKCNDTMTGPLSVTFNSDTGQLEKGTLEHLAEPILVTSSAQKKKVT